MIFNTPLQLGHSYKAHSVVDKLLKPVLASFICHLKICYHFAANHLESNKKATAKRWLNSLILKLKFGGPCWV